MNSYKKTIALFFLLLTGCSIAEFQKDDLTLIKTTLTTKKATDEVKMKTIGMLGGTGWSSTISYYKMINEAVGKRLGGYHSAKILLKSIDYHEILSNYGINHGKIASLLKEELEGLVKLNPDCFIICCNSLHKYYDLIQEDLAPKIPIFHAVHLVAENLLKKGYKNVLLLATQFTMEDGFFAKILEKKGITVTIPNMEERKQMSAIHNELMKDNITNTAKNYFSSLIKKYDYLDAVVLGCTEYPLIVNKENSVLPILNPVEQQVEKIVDFALEEKVRAQ